MSDDDQTVDPPAGFGKGGAGRRRIANRRKSAASTSLTPDGRDPGLVRAPHPAIVVFSSDSQVVGIAADAAGKDWVVRQTGDIGQAHDILSKLKVRLVVIDDANIAPTVRGWLLEQVRKLAGSALVIYIAEQHDLDGERRARAHPVQFYTARPLDADLVRRVLDSFVRAAS
jgi:hypothetical protein